jgi:hypothetical protein
MTRKTRTNVQQEIDIEVAGATDPHSPGKMTVAESAILTIKVLAGFALLGGAVWGINLWNAVE